MFEYAILIEGSNSNANTSTRIKRLKESKQGRMADAWLSEAMKDVISCDKLRVGANDL